MQKDKLQQTEHSHLNEQRREFQKRVNSVKECKTNAIKIRNAEGDNLWKTRSTS